jgi:alpha-mannosidase
VPLALPYNLAGASNHGVSSPGGFDGQGNSLPAEMLPSQIAFNDVHFQLASAKTGAPNALVPKGQTLDLPAGNYNRIYILAASSEGDQKAAFKIGNATIDLNVQNWGGFIGQWDDRTWSSTDTSHDDYGEMTGIKPGYIKRADLAWYCSHHYNSSGENVSYSYSYLFAYYVEIPLGAKTLTLPVNDNIRIMAISLAEDNPFTKTVLPLYDLLSSSSNSH